MEQARATRAHRILVAAEIGQCMRDESLQMLQGLIAIQRPWQGLRVRCAKTAHAGGFDRVPYRAVIVSRAPILWRRRVARPRRTIVVIEVPAPAFRFAGGIEQDPMLAPHTPIKHFHAPWAAGRKTGGDLIARGQKMFAVDHARGKGLRGAPML